MKRPKDIFEELHWRFSQDYVSKFSEILAERYSVPVQQVKQVVYSIYFSEMLFKNIIAAHYKALDEVLGNYYDTYLEKELKEILEEEKEQKLTDEQISSIKNNLVLFAKEDPLGIIEKYPELYDVYYKTMYSVLEEDLKNVERLAEENVKVLAEKQINPEL